jgi:hypothetical protein
MRTELIYSGYATRAYAFKGDTVPFFERAISNCPQGYIIPDYVSEDYIIMRE